MPRIAFDQLPPDARLWIFAAERPLSTAESTRILEETDAFINQWMAHGVPLSAGRDLRHNQFVLVGVDERADGVSGADRCARTAHAAAGIGPGDRAHQQRPRALSRGESVVRVPRDRFAELASPARQPSPRVFDNPSRASAICSPQMGSEAADSWHAGLLLMHHGRWKIGRLRYWGQCCVSFLRFSQRPRSRSRWPHISAHGDGSLSARR